jgi:tRNA (adenine22-N1)-methyltransferase
VAEVGCDHGKLAAYLAMNGAVGVIATDISAKSLNKAKKLVKELKLQHAVKTRVSDGLEHVKPGEADVLVIAGMGGPAICSILEEGRAVVARAAQLILQPMNAVGAVRGWIIDNGLHVDREEIVEDEGRLYHVISVVHGATSHQPAALFDLEIGSWLIEHRHPLLPRLLQERVETIDKIMAEIDGINTPKAESRRIELNALRARCMEMSQWLAESGT